jgi:alcohol dehydrogenase
VSLVAEERTLKGSYLGSCVPERDIPQYIDWYRSGRLPVDQLLSERIRLDEINAAFDRLAAGASIRQVIELG